MMNRSSGDRGGERGYQNDRSGGSGSYRDRGGDRGRGRGGRPFDQRRDQRNSGGYNRQQEERVMQRNKYDETDDFENRLNSLIIRVGDKSNSSLESNLDALAGALESDIGKHKNGIIDILFKCVTALPVKTSVYGTLVGLINIKNFDFGRDVVAKAVAELEQALEREEFFRAKFLLRFLAELSNANVITGIALIALFDMFVGVSGDDISHEQQDWYVGIVMATLPWVGPELSKMHGDDLSRLLAGIETYLADRRLRSLPVVDVYESEDSSDHLDLLWRQLTSLRADDWQTTSILRPYLHFEGRLNQASQHPPRLLKIPHHTQNTTFPLPRAVFRLFDTADLEKGLKPIDRYVLEDNVVDLLYFFNSSHKEGVKFILQLPTSANVDHIIVETIFSQLFLLPKPPFKELYYAIVFIDLFKQQPSVIPVFAAAVDLLFSKIDIMDVECVERFSEWLAIHLSNFDYKWAWGNWEFVLKEDEQSPKRRFCEEVLARCVRLSYFERVQQSLPEEFYVLMPPKPIPHFKFDAEEIHGASEAKTLLGMMRSKQGSEQVQKYVAESISPNFGADEKLEIVVMTLLQAGFKSFSHLLNTIERYLSLLNSLVKTSQQKQAMVHSVHEFWQYSPQHSIILLDKLLSYKVVDGSSVINWLFSAANQPNFTRAFVWEILFNTINKTIARCDTLERELKSAKDNRSDKTRSIEFNLEQTQREQRELLLLVLQRFSQVLQDRLAVDQELPTSGSLWYRNTAGHLKACARRYYSIIKPFLSTFDSLLAATDPRIVAIFNQIKQLPL